MLMTVSLLGVAEMVAVIVAALVASAVWTSGLTCRAMAAPWATPLGSSRDPRTTTATGRAGRLGARWAAIGGHCRPVRGANCGKPAEKPRHRFPNRAGRRRSVRVGHL